MIKLHKNNDKQNWRQRSHWSLTNLFKIHLYNGILGIANCFRVWHIRKMLQIRLKT